MTTEEQEQLISELMDIANRLPLWGLVTVVWRLQKRVNTLLDARLNNGALGRDDLEKEVIE